MGIISALGVYQATHGLSDYDVAEILGGISRDTVARWRRRPPTLTAKTLESLLDGIKERNEKATIALTELERPADARASGSCRRRDGPRRASSAAPQRARLSRQRSARGDRRSRLPHCSQG